MIALPRSVIGAAHRVYLFVGGFGRFTDFTLSTFRWMAVRPSCWLQWSQLAPQLFRVGVASVPVVAIVGVFIGMILSLEGYAQFAAIGQEDRMGGVINAAVTKQIGPVLAAVMVAGRVGGALAAELGSMKVTEQLDAMRAMAADPLRTLVAPRVAACVIMTPLLTIYSDLLGSWGAWFVSVRIHGISGPEYWHFTGLFVTWWEPMTGILKSVVFGLCIGLISCYKGFHCSAGATGVGRAATASFVASFLAIIATNLVLAEFLAKLQAWIDPNSQANLLS
ncbi:MAG: ABC transporter permease [Phycisphaerae bacterium]|jgi:phospholipid/cholesterol/gamma-HCH transport system permease protein|nr:ABC transporter permease [Phycisphaerae bacterium]